MFTVLNSFVFSKGKTVLFFLRDNHIRVSPGLLLYYGITCSFIHIGSFCHNLIVKI